MKTTTVWIVTECAYFQEGGGVSSVHRTKALAVKRCRRDGFRFERQQDCFCNDDTRLYRRLEWHPVDAGTGNDSETKGQQ